MRAQVLGWSLFAVAVVLLCGQFWQGVNPQDEGELLTYPWLIAQGRVPYVDFWTMYPPATFMTLAGLFKVGVPGLFAERGLGLLARLVCVVLVNRAISGSWRRLSPAAASVSLTLMFLCANVSLAAYAWIVGLPVVLAGLLLVREGRTGPAAAAFWIAALFRIEFGIAGVLCLGAYAGFHWWGGNVKVRQWRPLAGLTAAILGFYLLLDFLTGGRAISQIVLDPVLRIEPYRRVLLFPPLFGPLGVPAAVAVLFGPPLLVLLAARFRRPHIGATNLALCALIPQVIQDADWSHLFGVAAICVPWALLSLFDLAGGQKTSGGPVSPVRNQRYWSSRALPAAVLWIGISVGLLYSLVVLGYGLVASPLSPLSARFLPKTHLFQVGSGANILYARTRAEARDDREVAAYIRRASSANTKVFIAPHALRRMDYNVTDLYYVLGMEPASIYLEANPGLETEPQIQREIIGELHDASWVVLWKDAAQERAKPLGPPLLAHYIARTFRVVLENKTYIVLRDRQSHA